MLKEAQIDNIKEAKNIIFASSGADNLPRAVIVQPSRVEENRIIICNIQMGKTFENLKENPQCFINVFIPEADDLQYKIEGKATILSSGELFDEIKYYEENENGLLDCGLSVKNVIVVDMISFQESNG